MLENPNFQPNGDYSDWSIASENWLAEVAKMQPKRRLRERCKAPLILCGHGVSLRIENDALVIRDGFTHYPQEQAKYQFFRGDLELPPRIILLDGSGTLSFDVLSWLGAQNIALARVKWNGEVAVVASGSGYAADRSKIEWQQQTRADDARRFAFAADLIWRKLFASVETMKHRLPPSPARDIAIERTLVGIARMENETFTDINGIFSVEGECAGVYFTAWRGVPIAWAGTAKRPIPDDWRQFSSRMSLLSGKDAKSQRASHPVNAMLNYAYTVKQAQLHISTVAQGFDPSLGIMHSPKQSAIAYILDIVEPERPRVDAAILKFIAKRKFSAADFVIRNDGVCRLSPQLARAVAGVVMAG